MLESWAVTGRHCIALSSPQGTAASTLSWNMQTAGCWHSLEKEGLEDSEAAQLVVFRLQSCHCIASLYCISITNSPTCRRDGTCNLYAVPVTMQDRAALIKSTPPPHTFSSPSPFPPPPTVMVPVPGWPTNRISFHSFHRPPGLVECAKFAVLGKKQYAEHMRSKHVADRSLPWFARTAL